MTSNEERLKILQMIQDGKISAEEGAKLLEALGAAEGAPKSRPQAPRRPEGPRTLRIRVTDMDSGKSKVSVNLPFTLAEAGMGIAARFAPGLSSLNLQEAIEARKSGKMIDVIDEEDRERVEIFVD